MPKTAYHLAMPVERTTSVVFASPHSGRFYPADFLRNSQLDHRTIRSSEDAFVDLLIDSAPSCGAPLLSAHAPRAFVDLNRSADELDPALISDVRQSGHNIRISSGLGVIPRVVSNGREIRSGKIALDEANQRLKNYYFPYHSQLQRLLDDSMAMYGQSILLDFHSMPHEALATGRYLRGGTPDIVLGDRFGAACGEDIADAVAGIFTSAGLQVARNSPFAGAHIVQHYGKPAQGQHAIQIEIDRRLYLDNRKVAPNENFEALKALLEGVIEKLTMLGRTDKILTAAE